MNKFRTLRADEIDCRVSQVTESGVMLLLYKDARCDQNILDETVGPLNWQRHHSRENANCTVSIWDEQKGQWVEKEDTGVESRTEKEKGLASDSFKRACFNWGIGRELYTAPFIFVPAAKCNIKKDKNGSLKCYDNFTVEEIEYQPDGQREIRKLVIYNEKKSMACYRWEIGERKAAQDTEPQAPATTPAKSLKTLMNAAIEVYGRTDAPLKFDQLMMAAGVTRETMTEAKYDTIYGWIMDDLREKKGA